MKKVKAAKKSFSRMGKAEKRLAIAKDVLLQLEAKRYEASPGIYTYMPLKNAEDHIPEGAQLRDHLDKVKKCHVCALGAAAISAARVFDKVGIGVEAVVDTWEIHLEWEDVVARYFPDSMAYEMENAFECGIVQGGKADENGDMLKEYKAPGRTPKARLSAVMRNIVRNKGNFVPGDWRGEK